MDETVPVTDSDLRSHTTLPVPCTWPYRILCPTRPRYRPRSHLLVLLKHTPQSPSSFSNRNGLKRCMCTSSEETTNGKENTTPTVPHPVTGGCDQETDCGLTGPYSHSHTLRVRRFSTQTDSETELNVGMVDKHKDPPLKCPDMTRTTCTVPNQQKEIRRESMTSLTPIYSMLFGTWSVCPTTSVQTSSYTTTLLGTTEARPIVHLTLSPLCLMLLARLDVSMVNFCSFGPYRLIGKLTAFLQLHWGVQLA